MLTLGDFLATTGVGLLGRAQLVERLWAIGVELAPISSMLELVLYLPFKCLSSSHICNKSLNIFSNRLEGLTSKLISFGKGFVVSFLNLISVKFFCAIIDNIELLNFSRSAG